MKNSKIESLRKELYKINKGIVMLIKKRNKITRKIFQIKKKHHLPKLDRKQELDILDDAEKQARKNGITPSRARAIVSLFIEEGKIKNQKILKR